jgi:hypothetical protein
MIAHFLLSGMTIFSLLVLFLVLSKTLNGIVNQLLKIEFMLQKECEFKEEEKEIQRLIQEKILEGGSPDENEE